MAKRNKENSNYMLAIMIFIVFLVLKLTGVIAWSWWWVTSPLWVPFAAIFGVLFCFIILALVFGVEV